MKKVLFTISLAALLVNLAVTMGLYIGTVLGPKPTSTSTGNVLANACSLLSFPAAILAVVVGILGLLWAGNKRQHARVVAIIVAGGIAFCWFAGYIDVSLSTTQETVNGIYINGVNAFLGIVVIPIVTLIYSITLAEQNPA